MDGNFLMHMVLVEHQLKREQEQTRHNPDIEPGMVRRFLPTEVLRDLIKR